MPMTDRAPWYSLPNPPLTGSSSPGVVIIGAGLAGCWLARTLAERGIRSTLLEAADVASGASGNTAGVVKPYVTRESGFIDHFYDQAFNCLLERLEDWHLTEPCGFTRCGVLQLSRESYQACEMFSYVTPSEAHDLVGLPVNCSGLWFRKGGFLNPASLCRALLNHQSIKVMLNTRVVSISTDSRSAQIHTVDGRSLQADIVVLASGYAMTEFPATANIPVIPASGQTSDVQLDASLNVPRCVVSGKHYVIPRQGSVTVGATFRRGNTTCDLRDEEHASNLAGLRALLPGLPINSAPLSGNAGVRATTPDRLPLVGPVPDHAATNTAYHDIRHGRPLTNYPRLPTIPRLMVLGGFGSRGIVTTAYCAQLLADYLHPAAIGSTSTSGDSLASYASLISPVRFQIRDLRRSQ